MSWRPQVRRIRLDGTEAIVLTPDTYERLDKIRRQAGAQADRVHELRQQLADATALLADIEQAARGAECTAADEHAALCLREKVLAILGSAAFPGRHPSRRSRPDRQD